MAERMPFDSFVWLWSLMAKGHRGAFVWVNDAELVWQCADACPHPSCEADPQ